MEPASPTAVGPPARGLYPPLSGQALESDLGGEGRRLTSQRADALMELLWLKVGVVTAGFLGMMIWVALWARGNEDGE